MPARPRQIDMGIPMNKNTKREENKPRKDKEGTQREEKKKRGMK